MDNPLLDEPTLPYGLQDFAAITDAQWREAILQGMADQRAALAELAASSEPATAHTVLEAWEASDRLLRRAADGFFALLSSDTNDARDAIEAEISPLLAAHADAIALDRRLHERLLELRRRADAGEVELDEQERWLLDERLRSARRLGVDLPEAEQDRLRELNQRIATLQSAWSPRVVAGRNAAAVHVTDVSDLDGLSAADIAAARAAAERRGVDGWVLELVNTTGQPLLARLTRRDVRRRLFEASVGRGLAGEHDTREIVVELARLRAERARLLGFEHHAAFVADDGCAGTTETVSGILARVAPPAMRNAHAEAAVLQARLEADEPGATLAPWDWQFYAEAERTERLSLDDEALRPYLAFERVLVDGVFAAATALYGITFSPREDLVGHTEDCRIYEVREAGGETLGLVVLDPYTRPSKQGGAWMTSLVEQNHLLGELPVVTNDCNLVPPAPGAPTLMSWEEVIVLFHEFGHDLHGLLSDVRYPSRSGPEVPKDFVEYPSQVNEMWAWDPAIMAAFARHHETGEPMPAAWIESLRASRHLGEGYAAVESYAATILDQAWHTTPLEELPATVDEVEAFEQAVLERHGVAHPLIPPRYRTAYFNHVWSGNYDAAYYAYLWSEVLAADTVAWFEENGGGTRATGERFRREVLGRGGSVDVMECYRRFRGADPDVTHLLRRRGLEESAAA